MGAGVREGEARAAAVAAAATTVGETACAKGRPVDGARAEASSCMVSASTTDATTVEHGEAGGPGVRADVLHAASADGRAEGGSVWVARERPATSEKSRGSSGVSSSVQAGWSVDSSCSARWKLRQTRPIW
eukprot:scaffold24932_cov79-Isochrysis_galbana.AAC.1